MFSFESGPIFYSSLAFVKFLHLVSEFSQKLQLLEP